MYPETGQGNSNTISPVELYQEIREKSDDPNFSPRRVSLYDFINVINQTAKSHPDEIVEAVEAINERVNKGVYEGAPLRGSLASMNVRSLYINHIRDRTSNFDQDEYPAIDRIWTYMKEMDTSFTTQVQAVIARDNINFIDVTQLSEAINYILIKVTQDDLLNKPDEYFTNKELEKSLVTLVQEGALLPCTNWYVGDRSAWSDERTRVLVQRELSQVWSTRSSEFIYPIRNGKILLSSRFISDMKAMSEFNSL